MAGSDANRRTALLAAAQVTQPADWPTQARAAVQVESLAVEFLSWLEDEEFQPQANPLQRMAAQREHAPAKGGS